MTDWPGLYRAHVAALAQLAPTLSAAQLATEVPATPAWSVHEVYAHLAGGASDMVTGRMDGAPQPEWTSRHVGERAPLPIGELVAELESHQESVAESLADAEFPAAVFDISVHHADLHEALGLHRLPDPLWLPVAEAMSARAADLAAAVPAYELFRGVFSRRSRGQMLGWGSPLTAAELDAVCVFGPREDDQPVPVQA